MADTPTTDLWIGLRKSYQEAFYWTDGQPRQYVNLNLEVSGQKQKVVL